MASHPERTREYVTGVCDSRRWDHYRPRAGDIVVCTGPKCGTTWMQMIAALLVHGTPELPRPLTQLSRWIDRLTLPIEDIIAAYEAQTHRRVFKTHTPLDGLPYFPEVHYIVCGRDPRDAFLSFLDHVTNVSPESMKALRERSGAPDDFELPSDPNVLFPLWATAGLQPWASDGAPFGLPVVYLAETFWEYRHLPNIHFTHYADLRRDLGGEMQRLAALLGIDGEAFDWPALVAAASFDAMRRDADRTAPDADVGEWVSNGDFFRAARMGTFADVLSSENLDIYERCNSARLEPALKHWLEHGGPVG